ncbi:MAG: PD-(D/E)XK nuclease family transposase [Bacteroidales bacterium]|nr:PD-(D/E)XK nuclease family transposase [Bacteroidales bacterium]
MFLNEKDRYINPYTDFGFKKLFGTELNKELLISFLNALLVGKENTITDVKYLNTERLGDLMVDRHSVFDVYCETADGSRFVVEMQKADQFYFKDRTVYYAATVIREQAPRGDWDYHLKDVYVISLLDFTFPKGEYPEDSFRHEVVLMDKEFKQVFYDKLTFIYLEMPKFTKTEDELETMFDKWMFAIKNLCYLLDRPKTLQEKVFTQLFDEAEIAKYTPAERWSYEDSMNAWRDNYNTNRTAYVRGEMSGTEKTKLEIAHRMKAEGFKVSEIAEITGLTEDEIQKL